MKKAYIGTVTKGQARAEKLGFPTVNIPLPDTEVFGVYAAEVVVPSGRYPAVAFADPSRGVLEAHLLDFSGDLYGETVTIELHRKIRDAKRFETDEELVRAISADAKEARDYLAKRP